MIRVGEREAKRRGERRKEEEGDIKCHKVTVGQWSSDACQLTNDPPLRRSQ